MRVHVLIRVPEPDLGNGTIVDPESPEGPLVLDAKPDLAGHLLPEREYPDIAEIVRQQVFVKYFRADIVPKAPHFHEKCVSRFEYLEIVRKRRVVRVLLPPVAHQLREFFCIADCQCTVFFRASLSFGVRG
jgi:hypothetical protein